MRSKRSKGFFSGINVRNLVALSANTFTIMIIQLTTVPIFLHYLSFNAYAHWIVTSSIAQITGLLDFGMVAAAQNSFSYRRNRTVEFNLRNSVTQIFNFQITAFMVTYLVILIADLLHIIRVDCLLLAILSLSQIVQSYFGILEATSQMNSRVYKGIHASSLSRLLEYLGIVISCILFTQSLASIALMGLILKIAFLVHLKPKFESSIQLFKFGKWNLNLLHRSILEGIPYLIIKLTDYLIFNGALLVAQSKLSASEFIFFSSCRTFFRIGLQLTGLMNHGFAYDMTNAWSLNNYGKMKELIIKSRKITFFLTVLTAIFYLSFGKLIFSTWTHRSMELNLPILFAGICYSTMCSINQSQKTNYNALNANSKVSGILFIFSSLQMLYLTFSTTGLSVVSLFYLLFLFEFSTSVTIFLVARNDLRLKFT
jgi:O-antigen/teichoic acid export membrane protein